MQAPACVPTRVISKSELIINDDGTVFHLHLLPGQLSDKIVLVGDPERVSLVASHFDTIEIEARNREFHCITGSYGGKRVSVVSHGIGTDNIDIVLTELDALFNIDFKTRQVKNEIQTLTLIRIGTSGSLQPYLPVGSHCISAVSIGLDTVLHYYEGGDRVIDHDISNQFVDHTKWDTRCGYPYAVHADAELISRFEHVEDIGDFMKNKVVSGRSDTGCEAGDDYVLIHRGMTLSAVGFYGPQGRELRLPLMNPGLNESIEQFSYQERRITNYEMESSALAGLSALLGHKAVTICTIIANRFIKTALPNYKTAVDNLIKEVLKKI